MSKTATGPAAKPVTLPAEALEALEAARAGLAERKRLLALQRKLTTDLAEARRLVIKRNEAVGFADTEVILAGETPPAELVEAAEQARAAAQNVAHVVVRLEHALAAIPGRLLTADDAIEAATRALEMQRQKCFEAARADYDVQLRSFVDYSLAGVLRRGHAINAAYRHSLRAHLDGITIPAPFYGDQPILREGNRLTAADGSMVEISDTWRQDAAAVALYEIYAPLQSTLDAVKPEAERIRLLREDARVAGRASNWPGTTSTGGPPPAPPPPYVPPPRSFSPTPHPLVREVGTPAPTAKGGGEA